LFPEFKYRHRLLFMNHPDNELFRQRLLAIDAVPQRIASDDSGYCSPRAES